MAHKMREGDIYRWKYPDKDEVELGPYGSYHCKSQIAIYDGERLVDTFWNTCPTANSYLDPEKVELTLLGNKNELVVFTDREELYDPSDLVIMRHANNTSAKTLVKPDAKRSKQRTIVAIASKIRDAENAILSAQRDLQQLSVALYKAENEDLSEVYF